MRLIRVIALLACFAAPALAPAPLLADDKKDEKKADYADGEDGLKKLGTDLIEAAKAKDQQKLEKLCGSLALQDPGAFFKKHFGDKGAAVAEGYDKMKAEMGKGLAKEFTKCAEKGRTEVTIRKAEGDQATGAQKSATEAMKEKITLWTISLAEPGQKLGTTYWSFAYVDGGWKFLGKMRELSKGEK
jgi:hypothetical protein